MKKRLIRIFICVFLAMGFAYSAGAQRIYVRVHPAAPVRVRTVAPGPHHVWVAEDWRPSGNTYVYSGGYWAAPPRPGAIWVPGHWRRHRNGDYWIAGHWR